MIFEIEKVTKYIIYFYNFRNQYLLNETFGSILPEEKFFQILNLYFKFDNLIQEHSV